MYKYVMDTYSDTNVLHSIYISVIIIAILWGGWSGGLGFFKESKSKDHKPKPYIMLCYFNVYYVLIILIFQVSIIMLMSAFLIDSLGRE